MQGELGEGVPGRRSWRASASMLGSPRPCPRSTGRHRSTMLGGFGRRYRCRSALAHQKPSARRPPDARPRAGGGSGRMPLSSAAVLEHRVERFSAHARHAVARQWLSTRACSTASKMARPLRPLGAQAGVQLAVVVAQPSARRRRIRRANAHLLASSSAAAAAAAPCCPTGPGGLATEGDLQFGVARDGAHAVAATSALERPSTAALLVRPTCAVGCSAQARAGC